MRKLKVNFSSNRECIIYVGKDLSIYLANFLEENSFLNYQPVIITDTILQKKYLSKIKLHLRRIYQKIDSIIIPAGEKSKSWDIFLKVVAKLLQYERMKTPFIISLGGGVVGDLAGFVASVYKRGIRYIQVPTTLLAQVDSSIGGKVAIDLDCGKNLIGSFYQPNIVVVDVNFLKTLPISEIKAGLAEVIKYGIISDEKILKSLEDVHPFKWEIEQWEEVILRCIKIKTKIVAADEHDTKDIRIKLNFGHTLGHAIESAGEYKYFTHGEAVSLGILGACYISYEMGMLDLKLYNRISALIKNLGLRDNIDGKLNWEQIISHLPYDKKARRGRNRFVLLNNIGDVEIRDDVPIQLIKDALLELGAR